MNFSICLPTLGNAEMVLKMLDSFERTTKWKDKIEVLFAIDEGQVEIVEIVNARYYSFKILFFERPKTEDFTNDYYNYLASRSKGKNVIAFNDDAWMRTQDWDEKILRTVGEYGWSIYMLDIPDTARIKYKNPFPCFPCVSRRSLNTLGWLLCKDVKMYPADLITAEVYRCVERIIPIRDVLIEHEHVLETDPSKKRMMELFNKDQEEKKKEPLNINPYVETLKQTALRERNTPSKFRRILNILREQ